MPHNLKKKRENESTDHVEAWRKRLEKWIANFFYIVGFVGFVVCIAEVKERYFESSSMMANSKHAVISSAAAPSMLRCPAFSKEKQSCSFGSKQTWASTGSEKGLEPCIYPLPPAGNYTLYYDGAHVWMPGTTTPVSNYGFASNAGVQTITYFLRPYGQCPPNL